MRQAKDHFPYPNREVVCYDIAGDLSGEVCALLHVADADRPSDFEQFYSVILKGNPRKLSFEYSVHDWLTSLCWHCGVFYATSMSGNVYIYRNGFWSQEFLGRSITLNSIRALADESLFAVGMKGLALEWQDKAWRQIRHRGHTDLITLAGNRRTDVHVLGENGRIWHYDSSRFYLLDSLTNAALTDACALSNEQVVICGEDGLIMYGRENEWLLIEQLDEDLYSVAALDDTALVAAGSQGLWKLKDKNLQLIESDVAVDGVRSVGSYVFIYSGMDIRASRSAELKVFKKVQLDFTGLILE